MTNAASLKVVQTRRELLRRHTLTAVVSLPLKYMHSPVETLCLEDMEHVAALLAAFVQGLGEEAPEA